LHFSNQGRITVESLSCVDVNELNRKAGCRRLAEAGCTVHEIAAISGHKILKEIERYTSAVSQAKLADAAMAKTMVAAEQNGSESVKTVPGKVSKPLKGLRKKAS
jgi:hypothetical protein